MTYQKKSSKKWPIAIALIVIISVATGAALYLTLPEIVVDVGVKAGDTFTYSLSSQVQLNAANATVDPGFDQYNQTDYYKITITDVTGTNVSMSCEWRFLNGTSLSYLQSVDIATGAKSDENGFWALYPANLKIGSYLRPRGYDQQTVNNTDTTNYASGSRSRCYWHIENAFTDPSDQSGETMRYDYVNIFFDRQTGMMTSFANWQVYTNPSKAEAIFWTLKSSSVWEV
jgi:hypothetical protein